MTWVILSLNILSGDFALIGSYQSQKACLTSLKTSPASEFTEHVRQCVPVKDKHLSDYVIDKKDWEKLI